MGLVFDRLLIWTFDPPTLYNTPRLIASNAPYHDESTSMLHDSFSSVLGL